MTLAFQGIGIGSAQAIALGPAFIDSGGQVGLTQSSIAVEEIPGELARFERAVDAARLSLKEVRAQIPHETPIEIVEFIDTHLLMLKDQALIEEVRRRVADERCSAEWALQRHLDSLLAVFERIEDPYLRARGDDLAHVVRQIQRFLNGTPPPPGRTERDLSGYVVVARDLMPTDVLLLHQRGIGAFVTEYGGPMSHTAILARSLGIPAVVGLHAITRYLRAGELLIVDGRSGTVIADPDTQIVAAYRAQLQGLKVRRDRLRTLAQHPARTRDGVEIQLQANLELPEDVELAKLGGASGIGLYRTEFLYMNRPDLPDEEEHLANYRAILAQLDGRPITIRTLDLGLDKHSGAFATGGASNMSNPALGLRGIRLCLKEPELFTPQVRAILRSSALGPVRLMLPLVTSVHEVERTLALITHLKQQLDREGLDYDPQMPVGAMIEVPAAALTARAIARRVDFLSIGTNDLIQYTLAVDRLDESVNDLFDPLHPAILRLIRLTLEAGRALAIPVGMCGEMAGDPRFTRLLLGMGLREFSMHPGALLDVKEIVLGAELTELSRRVDHFFEQLDEADPARFVAELNAL
ncbi:phosphoenolpyruvate--protein phosphotransferase [Caldichromatium japonicum]|uniref:Phosphoenolpyruvate-protein phosphotransferase n=1 Tax=Caldichromatium japonicum TaxID=2699430 RepID=A0A6G7VAP3_9GAMM|nr:phosphoenolpyruvate--protein phosphotransferase [Caldichromatium japonicum]QIK36936.1 phosphoenolpyruvate--protein phosphotransferase [Caldichromatium japonicum]